MKLLFKQKFFSWLDSYDVFTESGETLYTVKGQLAWGHTLKIFDIAGNCLGTVKERVFSFLPKFEMYRKDTYLGCIKKEFTFLKPRFSIDMNGWQVEGDWFEWDYTIYAPDERTVATVSKEIWNWTDTYTIDVADPRDALEALMLVIAIDCEKCSRDNN